MKEEAASGLLKGVVAVLSKAPVNEVQPTLTKLCEVQLTHLVELSKVRIKT